jgi:hypothetical protein
MIDWSRLFGQELGDKKSNWYVVIVLLVVLVQQCKAAWGVDEGQTMLCAYNRALRGHVRTILGNINVIVTLGGLGP